MLRAKHQPFYEHKRPAPPSIMRRAHAQVQENQQLFDRNFFTTKHSARSLFLKPQRLYSKCWGNPAMAINGRRNKPFGPGGSTRRLHPLPARLGFGGGEIGSTRA